MTEMLRASLEEATTIRTQNEALDFIAKRGHASSQEIARRIRYATVLLQGDFLPHISQSPEGMLKKAYFVGYMVNRLLKASLGHTGEDDRDYYGKKRLDMCGSLLSQLYR